MVRTQILEIIKCEKLVPIIRAANTDDARKSVEVLSSGGIKVFEISLTVPNAIDVINELTTANGNVLIGAGTVTDKRQAEECIRAGAQFIVSPAFDPETILFCRENEICVIPGALTPSEVLAAHKAGADCIKIFPCDTMGGAKYLKNLKTVFPEIKMIPAGGINIESVGDFFRAGAFAVGVGADLVDAKAIRQGNIEPVIEHAKKYLTVVEPF